MGFYLPTSPSRLVQRQRPLPPRPHGTNWENAPGESARAPPSGKRGPGAINHLDQPQQHRQPGSRNRKNKKQKTEPQRQEEVNLFLAAYCLEGCPEGRKVRPKRLYKKYLEWHRNEDKYKDEDPIISDPFGKAATKGAPLLGITRTKNNYNYYVFPQRESDPAGRAWEKKKGGPPDGQRGRAGNQQPRAQEEQEQESESEGGGKARRLVSPGQATTAIDDTAAKARATLPSAEEATLPGPRRPQEG